MLRAAICDDEPAVGMELNRLLEQAAQQEHVNLNTEIFCNGQELADSVERGSSYDLIYLDIEMDGTDGIQTAKKIRERDKTVLLTYVTGHEDYAKDVFEVQPFRFIVKPVREEIFFRYFRQTLEELRRGKADFRYHCQKTDYKIPYDSILYFESVKRSVKIYRKDGENLFYGKLDDVEKTAKECDAGFIRIHKSFLVNYRYVEQINFSYVILSNKTQLPVSESHRGQIQDALLKL